MKILNLYAGIGGNRALWGDKHDITAVENVPHIADVYRKLWPNDTVVEADAHQYLLDHYKEFDFIWSSPPCPTHSRARFGLGVNGKGYAAVYPDMKLYQEIIFLRHHFNGYWVVENVQAYYKPLIHPQSIGRHWYWANFVIRKIKVGYTGISGATTSSGKVLHAKNVSELEGQLGIDLSTFDTPGKRLMLRNAVEPEIGLHILNCKDNLKQEVLV